MIEVALTNRQAALKLDEAQLRQAAQRVLGGEGIRAAQVSLAVVDDPAMAELNRRFLHHDGPTDVLSFVLERCGESLEGEIVVSADTALAQAGRYGWAPHCELLLYVIHGALHLVGYDDLTPPQRRRMRARQRTYVSQFGWEVPYRPRPAAPALPPRQAKGRRRS